MRKLLLIVAVSLILSACSKTPMQKLQSDAYDESLNNAFWKLQSKQNKALWSEAIEYCKQHQEKVNCGSVIDVNAIQTDAATPSPGIGHSGNTLTVPNF